MMEGELGALAAEAYNLTEIGREALAAVIAEKGFNVKLADAPPPEEPRGVGDCEDELDLETMCQVKSEADARRAKGILDANHIASCLGPDNIADLANFKGSFAGEVDLKVFSEDSGRASRALQQYAPDLMRLEDETPEDEDDLDYAVTCPKCQSQDIVLDAADVRPENVERLYKYRWTCAACGHQWQDKGFVHIVNNNARGHSNSIDRTASDSERQRARDVAQAVLDGRATILEAARQLVSLAHTDAIEDVEDRRLFIEIDSETDDLPVGEVRKLWAPHALEIKDVEIARCEELYKPPFLEACCRIAGRPRQ
jgi:hypothetical protein